MNKKICFLVTDAISFNVLCRGQLEYIRDHSSFDITLVCGGDEKQLNILRERQIGKVINAKFQRQPSLLKDIKSLTFLIQYFLFNRFDIVVYSTPKALLLGSLASFITFQSKRFALIRGRAYENYFGSKRKLYEAFDRVALAASSEVIFISNSIKNAYLQDKLISEKKINLIGLGSSNGVDTLKYRPIADLIESNKQDKKEFDAFTIVMVGRVCADKGLFDIESIVKNITSTNVEILIIGRVEDKESEQFLDILIKRYSCIRYIPYTLNLIDYFQSADLHLFLSHREGFGNVAIEAASCGVPTFAYDVVGVKDSVKDNISGQRFKFKDTLAIAQAINVAAADVNFKQRYPFAREWVIKNFKQETVWKNYLDFYLQV